jgi:hypothetical protein
VTVTAPGTGGSPTSYTVTATDATTPGHGGQTCTVTGGSGSCTLYGLTNGDHYTFTSTATNTGGTSAASPASAAIIPQAPVAPVFTADSPPGATAGTAYLYTFAASGTPAPTFTVTTGALPAGLTLTPTTGVLSGTPTGSGTFVVTATNSAGSVATSSITIVAAAVPVFTAQTPPMATVGTPYTYTFAASGSPAPTFTVTTGVLPAGLTLNPTTGVLSGTPTGSGTFVVTATNSAGSIATSSITIVGAVLPVLTADTPPGATVGTAYSYTFVASGPPAPTFTVTTGALPGGLTLNSATGVLSGTPTGSGTFVVTATNFAGSIVTASITIVAAAVPVFTAHTPPPATIGSPYLYTFAASGPPAPTFTVTTGALPAGLTLNAVTGVLSGTPTGSGTFEVTATNSAGVAVTASITITASAAVVGVAPSGPHGTAGDSAVVASWSEPSPSTGISGYTAYADPGPATCSTASASDTSCVLGAVAGQSYTFTVVTHLISGADSVPSAASPPVTATAPAVPVVAPLSAPTTLSTTSGQVTSVLPSEPITVVGTGFAAYSTATVIIYSTATVLAQVTTDSHGDFSVPVVVPAGLEFGAHNFVASGVDPSGRAHVLRLPVTISAASAPAAANRVVAIADNRDGHFLTTAIGNVYNYDTKFWGSPHIRGLHLTAPVVGIATTTTGYVEVTAAGNLFNYRTAFHGSPKVARVKLASPVVAIATTATGGYLIATAAGSVYAFGTATHGSPASQHITLTSPVVGIATTANGGYLIATAAGNVYTYRTRFGGSPAKHVTPQAPISGIAAGNGTYRLTTTTGTVYTYRT